MRHVLAAAGLVATLLNAHLAASSRPLTSGAIHDAHWVEGAALPAPTPIISGLGTHYDAMGRYHSTLAPFSLLCPWSGRVFPDVGLSYDEFAAPSDGTRVITIFAPRNTDNLTGADLDARLIGQRQREGYDPQVASWVPALGQLHALWRFGHSGPQFAGVAFPARGRLWLLELASDNRHLAADLTVFVRMLDTLRLETGAR